MKNRQLLCHQIESAGIHSIEMAELLADREFLVGTAHAFDEEGGSPCSVSFHRSHLLCQRSGLLLGLFGDVTDCHADEILDVFVLEGVVGHFSVPAILHEAKVLQ